jgi:hypothetical protein
MVVGLPLPTLRGWFWRRLQKEPGFAFSVFGITIVSIVGIVLFLNFEILAFICVLTAATLLIRLDLQTQGCTDQQAFWVMVPGALAGLGVGWAGYYFLSYLLLKGWV